MSSFPDFLFKLTPRDEQTTPLELVYYNSSSGSVLSTQPNMTDYYTVPQGKILVLQSLLIEGAAGANQFPVWAGIQFVTLDASGDPVEVYDVASGRLEDSTLLPRSGKKTFIGNWILPPNIRIYPHATFDAAVVPNSIWATMSGILIPRGNFAV